MIDDSLFPSIFHSQFTDGTRVKLYKRSSVIENEMKTGVTWKKKKTKSFVYQIEAINILPAIRYRSVILPYTYKHTRWSAKGMNGLYWFDLLIPRWIMVARGWPRVFNYNKMERLPLCVSSLVCIRGFVMPLYFVRSRDFNYTVDTASTRGKYTFRLLHRYTELYDTKRLRTEEKKIFSPLKICWICRLCNFGLFVLVHWRLLFHFIVFDVDATSLNHFDGPQYSNVLQVPAIYRYGNTRILYARNNPRDSVDQYSNIVRRSQQVLAHIFTVTQDLLAAFRDKFLCYQLSLSEGSTFRSRMLRVSSTRLTLCTILS